MYKLPCRPAFLLHIQMRNLFIKFVLSVVSFHDIINPFIIRSTITFLLSVVLLSFYLIRGIIILFNLWYYYFI